MNPILRLIPAVYSTLANQLAWNGQPVPVYEHLNGNTPTHYVQLKQPTAAEAPGGYGCRVWSCTVLIDVITQFPTNAVSSVIADEVAGQIMGLIGGGITTPRRPRLVLPGYDCTPARLDLLSDVPPALDGTLIEVRRLLRYRWEVSYHYTLEAPPASAFPPFVAFDSYVFAGGFPFL